MKLLLVLALLTGASARASFYDDNATPVCDGSAIDARLQGYFYALWTGEMEYMVKPNSFISIYNEMNANAWVEREAWTCSSQGHLFLIVRFPHDAGVYFESRAVLFTPKGFDAYLLPSPDFDPVELDRLVAAKADSFIRSESAPPADPR